MVDIGIPGSSPLKKPFEPSTIGSKLGSGIGSFFSNFGNSIKRSFGNGVGFGAGFAVGNKGISLIGKLFPENAFGWFLLSSILLYLSDWFFFHFNYSNPLLYHIHILYAILWALLLTGADKESETRFIYRLIINIALFVFVLYFEFNLVTYLGTFITSTFPHLTWNRVFAPPWIIFSFFYCIYPKQRTRFVGVAIFIFLLMIFFASYNTIAFQLNATSPTIGQIASSDYMYSFLNKSITGAKSFFGNLSSNLKCLMNPIACTEQQTKNSTYDGFVDSGSYGLYFTPDVSGTFLYSNTENYDWTKSIETMGSLTSGSNDRACMADPSSCSGNVFNLYCLAWNANGSLANNYTILKTPLLSQIGPYSNQEGSTWDCTYKPKSKTMPKVLKDNPYATFAPVISFKYSTAANVDLFFIGSQELLALKNSKKSPFDYVDQNIKLGAHNTPGPIVISFGFPTSIKPPIPLRKNSDNNKMFVIKIDKNTNSYSNSNFNPQSQGFLYDFTKFYLYLPIGMTITPSDMCPFKEANVLDKDDAIGDLYGTSKQLSTATIDLIKSYNIYELNKSLLNTKSDDNSGLNFNLFGYSIPISNTIHNDAQMVDAIKSYQNNPSTNSIIQFYCQTKIDEAKIIGNHVVTDDKTYIYAEYNYLRYLPFSLSYNVPSDKATQNN